MSAVMWEHGESANTARPLFQRHGMPTFYNEEDIDKPSHFQSLAKAIVLTLASRDNKALLRRTDHALPHVPHPLYH
eukprot:2109508-Rhodomonas_salina.1